MIELRHLGYFLAVVDAKGFTAAANVLNVAQPSLSQHMQHLEEEFGHQLLIRHSRGVEATEAGLRLTEHVRGIMAAVEAAKSDLLNFDEQRRKQIHFGLPRSLGAALAVDMMKAWSEDYPNTDLCIVEQLSAPLVEWVQSGRLDVAVTSLPTDRTTIMAEPLLQDKMCLVQPRIAGVEHPGDMNFADLADETLIMPGSDSLTRQRVEVTAKYLSLNLNIAYEVDSSDLALRMVEEGLGSTVLPYLVVHKYVETKRAHVRLIVNPSIDRRLHFITLRRRPVSESHAEVAAALKVQLKRLFPENSRMLTIEFETERS